MVVKVGDLVMLEDPVLHHVPLITRSGVGVIIGPARRHRKYDRGIVTVAWTDGTCSEEWNTKLKPYEGDAGKNDKDIK